MRNIKLTIQYDGSRYKGWQKLGNTENTIQAKIEAVLKTILEEDVDLIASGRTDAGVHAENQIANFHTNSKININKILNHCYKYLPSDIVIKNAKEVPDSFHSRYNVSKKVYTYKIYNAYFHDAFKRKYTYHVKEKLDIAAMKKAASVLVGTHDFKSFSATKSKKKSTVRTIHSIDFKVNQNNVDIVFTGNGFLYKMVRILTGTLLDAGLNKISPEEIQKILDAEDRSLAPSTAPANGLILTNVVY